MALRRTSIRVRVFLLVLVPLLALTGIYAYAVAGEAGTAVGLSNAGKISGATITPVSKEMVALNAERSLAVGYLDTGSSRLMAEYREQAAATDRALRVIESISASGPVTANASTLEKAAAAKFLAAAGALPALRREVTGRAVGRDAAISRYSAIVTDGIQVIAQSLQETYVSQSLATTARQEVSLYESEMLVLQENDVYSGAILGGHMSAADQMTFGQLVSVRRYLVQDAVPQLDAVASGLYRQYVPARLTLALTRLEDAITRAPAGGARPPVPLNLWQGTVRTYATNLEIMLTKGPDWIQSQVTSSARSALVTLVVAASLGLLAVIASVIISVNMGRRLFRRLTHLRQSALALAHDRLPGLLARLRDGEQIDVDAEAPAAESSADEIDQVQQAFNVMHRAAVAAAVDEANLRRGINEVFRNLARRSQLLLHRQLGLLDGMERRAEEPGHLEDLFRIDHLTTRMRRHAEGLIVLSGESPGRGWHHPVPFIDVLRAAVAEVESYTRVRVQVRPGTALAGHAIADVVHLLAELIENATAFSPPDTLVRVQGDLVGRGFAVEVEDSGLGLTEEQLEQINRDLASLPAFDLSRSDRLGLFIAGRLAHRHDIRITLRPSAYGGITAIVIIPSPLVISKGGDKPGAGAVERSLQSAGPQALADGSREAGAGSGSVTADAVGTRPGGQPQTRIRRRTSGRHAADPAPR
jgi:signal transduction histidine kinase/CHASE3 domain sensor protein